MVYRRKKKWYTLVDVSVSVLEALIMCDSFCDSLACVTWIRGKSMPSTAFYSNPMETYDSTDVSVYEYIIIIRA